MLTDDKIFRDEDAGKFLKENKFNSAVKILLEEQKRTWPMAITGYFSLGVVKTKIFQFNGYTIKVQFNPGRITSSSAKVDEKSIKERRCFLCPENLPKDQKAIPYKNDFIILVNPFPIFPEHFTISSVKHLPQQIESSFGTLLSLSKDLGKKYTVFYNGPKCGASAPDHLHFQAGTHGFMPIDNNYEVLKLKYGEILNEKGDSKIYAVSDGLRNFISCESKSQKALEDIFAELYKIFSDKMGNNEEPMMNITASITENNRWKVLIFLREKHRPSHYFEEGEANILLSPASVDLGGVCITPLEKDFNKITQQNIEEIFSEVTINGHSFTSVKNRIKEIKLAH